MIKKYYNIKLCDSEYYKYDCVQDGLCAEPIEDEWKKYERFIAELDSDLVDEYNEIKEKEYELRKTLLNKIQIYNLEQKLKNLKQNYE